MWHIFTKDGNELTGYRCNINTETKFVSLYRYTFKNVSIDYSGLSRLLNPYRWFNPTITDCQEEKVTDYIIPFNEILRIERHDEEEK